MSRTAVGLVMDVPLSRQYTAVVLNSGCAVISTVVSESSDTAEEVDRTSSDPLMYQDMLCSGKYGKQ